LGVIPHSIEEGSERDAGENLGNIEANG